MGQWICDDRKTTEDWKKEWEFVHSMSDEEFDNYLKQLKEKEDKEVKESKNYDVDKKVTGTLMARRSLLENQKWESKQTL